MGTSLASVRWSWCASCGDGARIRSGSAAGAQLLQRHLRPFPARGHPAVGQVQHRDVELRARAERGERGPFLLLAQRAAAGEHERVDARHPGGSGTAPAGCRRRRSRCRRSARRAAASGRAARAGGSALRSQHCPSSQHGGLGTGLLNGRAGPTAPRWRPAAGPGRGRPTASTAVAALVGRFQRGALLDGVGGLPEARGAG